MPSKIDLASFNDGLPGRRPSRKLIDAIRISIENGSLKPGDRLPSQRELAKQLGLAIGTVTKAYTEAARTKLVSTEVGRGTFVLPDANKHSSMSGTAGGSYDLTFNQVAYEEAHPAELNISLINILKRSEHSSIYNYELGADISNARKHGANWLASIGHPTNIENVVICNGVQHGLFLTVQSLATPNTVILTEQLGYPGISLLNSILGYSLRGVEIDAFGLRMDDLRRACVETNSKILICAPSLHNPTNSVMPFERRQQLLEIAKEFDLSIVEYDVNGIPVSDPDTPFRTLAPERTYFISGTWKVTGLGASLGFISAPTDTVHRLMAAVQATSWSPSPLLREIVSTWIADGTAGRVGAWHITEISKRLALAQHAMDGFRYFSHPSSYNLWLELPEPWRRETFVDALSKNGVTSSPADIFVVGRAIAPHAVRLNLGGVNHLSALERALKITSDTLKHGPRPNLVMT